jgi:hypothetical protein
MGQGVSLYRIAQITISAVATIWIPPGTMKTPSPLAMARAVVSKDASSHTSKASRLMPADQRALTRWEIFGMYAAPASPAPAKPAISVMARPVDAMLI